MRNPNNITVSLSLAAIADMAGFVLVPKNAVAVSLDELLAGFGHTPANETETPVEPLKVGDKVRIKDSAPDSLKLREQFGADNGGLGFELTEEGTSTVTKQRGFKVTPHGHKTPNWVYDESYFERIAG